MSANLENSSGHRTGKSQFSSNPKECSNYWTFVLISHASKVMLKIIKLQLYMNWEIPDVQAGFRKGKEPGSNCQNLLDLEKAREFQGKTKTFTSASLTLLKPLTLWITTNHWKSLKCWECQTILLFFYVGQETTVRSEHIVADWLKIEKSSMSRLYIVTLLI